MLTLSLKILEQQTYLFRKKLYENFSQKFSVQLKKTLAKPSVMREYNIKKDRNECKLCSFVCMSSISHHHISAAHYFGVQ